MDDLIVFKKGFNYSQDGPGNRLVYHLLGCNMKCPWCSNSDGMNIKYSESYSYYSIQEIKKEILSAKRIFFDGGGVTFTGGEMSLQLDALLPLLKELKEEGINICTESNGANIKIKEALEYIDYPIFDFKHPIDSIHKNFMGISNSVTKEVIKYSTQVKDFTLIRIPLINGVNTDDEALHGFVDFFNELDKDKFSVEILLYHEYGKDKWEKQNRKYEIKDGFVKKETLNHFIEIFTKNKINLITT